MFNFLLMYDSYYLQVPIPRKEGAHRIAYLLCMIESRQSPLQSLSSGVPVIADSQVSGYILPELSLR